MFNSLLFWWFDKGPYRGRQRYRIRVRGGFLEVSAQVGFLRTESTTLLRVHQPLRRGCKATEDGSWGHCWWRSCPPYWLFFPEPRWAPNWIFRQWTASSCPFKWLNQGPKGTLHEHTVWRKPHCWGHSWRECEAERLTHSFELFLFPFFGSDCRSWGWVIGCRGCGIRRWARSSLSIRSHHLSRKRSLSYHQTRW